MEAAGGLTLDGLTRQLAAVRDRLLHLAADDFAGKYRVKVEQDRLRNLARAFASDADAYRSSKDLLAELDSRKQALETIRREMVYLGEGAKVNIEMRAARGTDQLVQRIAHLETILQERGNL
jgi:hypothetical protein